MQYLQYSLSLGDPRVMEIIRNSSWIGENSLKVGTKEEARYLLQYLSEFGVKGEIQYCYDRYCRVCKVWIEFK